MGTTSDRVFSGLFWKFGERICAQVVSVIVSTVLARILMPESFGLVAMVNIFITIANVFVSENLGSALIQKKDADQLDFDTIFYIALALSVILYVALFVTAPYIARFYGTQDLVWIIRVFAIKLPISAVSTVQHAYVSRHMIFRKFFFSTLIGTVLSGFIGVVMALIGMGAWALVSQYLANTFVDCAVLFITVPWKPRLEFSVQRARVLFGYGWKVLATGLISTIYGQLRGMVIGKVYTTEDLAYYNMGERFPALVGNNVDTTIGSVLFPAMSDINGDIYKVKDMTRRAMRMSAYVIFPLMTGLAVVSRPLILSILTEKWLPSLFFLRIFCFEKGMSPFSTANLQAMKAVGRSDILLKIEIIKKGIGIAAVLWSVQFGMQAIGYSCILITVFALTVNMVPNGKLLGYSFTEQIKDVAPIVFLNIGMALITAGVMRLCVMLGTTDFFILAASVVLGATSYIWLSRAFRIPEYEYLLNVLKKARR